MELKDFRTLLEIEKLGSISLAARSLYISQPGLSQFLHSYEQQLGFEVFERISYGVRPTKMGREYLALIRSVVDAYDTGLTELRGIERRPIRFGIGDQRGTLLIPAMMSMLNKMYQDFKLEINDTISSKNNLLAAVKDGIVDAACTTVIKEDYQTTGEIRVFPLVKEEIMLVVPKRHPIIERLQVDADGQYRAGPETLRNQTYILCDSKREIRKMSDQIFWNLNIRDANILQSSTNLFTVINSCLNCNALTFSPWEYVCNNDQCICASLGEKGVFWTHILMARSGALQKDELELLLQLVRESLITDMKNNHVLEEV